MCTLRLALPNKFLLPPRVFKPTNLMKPVKRYLIIALATLMLSSSLFSCATVFGGRVTAHQKQRPVPGEPTRQVRVGALIADILLFPLVSIPVDFATGAIYKPMQPLVQQAAEKQPVVAKQATKK